VALIERNIKMNESICSKKLYEAANKRFRSRSGVTLEEIISLRGELIMEAETIVNLLTTPQEGRDSYLKKLPKNLASKWGFTIYPIEGASKCGVYANIQLNVEDKLRQDVLSVGYCNDLHNYLRTSIKDEYKKHLTGESELLKTYNLAIAVCEEIILLVQSHDANA
jgi:hypothetical protein